MIKNSEAKEMSINVELKYNRKNISQMMVELRDNKF
jgi:hypothetical protein